MLLSRKQHVPQWYYYITILCGPGRFCVTRLRLLICAALALRSVCVRSLSRPGHHLEKQRPLSQDCATIQTVRSLNSEPRRDRLLFSLGAAGGHLRTTPTPRFTPPSSPSFLLSKHQKVCRVKRVYSVVSKLIFCALSVFTFPYLQQTPQAVGTVPLFALSLSSAVWRRLMWESLTRCHHTTHSGVRRLDSPFFWLMCDFIAELQWFSDWFIRWLLSGALERGHKMSLRSGDDGEF